MSTQTPLLYDPLQFYTFNHEHCLKSFLLILCKCLSAIYTTAIPATQVHYKWMKQGGHPSFNQNKGEVSIVLPTKWKWPPYLLQKSMIYCSISFVRYYRCKSLHVSLLFIIYLNKDENMPWNSKLISFPLINPGSATDYYVFYSLIMYYEQLCIYLY